MTDDSFDEIEHDDENGSENERNFEENEDEVDAEMKDDEDEDMSGDDSDDNGGDAADDMDEDVQSDEEEFVPVDLEDFEKLLQSKELALKAVQNTQKQHNEARDDEDIAQYDVESIWKPIHQGFGCGIGVLLNGQLPNLELPAELDDLKGGKRKMYL